MAAFFEPHGAGELLARYSYLEPLVEGRRVLEVGAVRSTEGVTAIALAHRGAAEVLAVEEGEGSLRDATLPAHPRVAFRDGGLDALPAGAFDLVLDGDGERLVADPDRLARLAALVGPDGFLVTAIAGAGHGLASLAGDPPPGDVPPYEPFVAALAERFPAVEVATQAAMVGWVLAPGDAAGGDAELAIDGTLGGVPEAAAYVAICGARPSGLGGLLLVPLPHRALADVALAHAASAREHAGCAAAAAARREETARLVEELEHAAARVAATRFEADAARQGLEAARAEADGAAAEAERAREEVGRLRADLKDQAAAAAARVEVAAAESADLARRLAETQAAVARGHAEADLLAEELKEVEARLQAALARAAEAERRAAAPPAPARPEEDGAAARLRSELAGAREALAARIAEVELERDRLRARADRAERDAEARRALVAQLAERDARIARLERELAAAPPGAPGSAAG